MEKTAVEWLEQQLGSKIADANIRISAPKFYELINQAKELEKQQIVDAYRVGKVEATLPSEKLTTGGKYYRELFKPE